VFELREAREKYNFYELCSSKETEQQKQKPCPQSKGTVSDHDASIVQPGA